MKRDLQVNKEKIDNNVKKEYKGIDIGKFIMALAVVAFHLHLYSGSNETINLICETFRLSVVPFFFLASGFFLYKEKGQEEVFKNTLKKIFKLYIIWQLIYLPLCIFELYSQGRSVLAIIAIIIRGFFLTGGSSYALFLWYLLSFIYTLILLLILKKLKLNDKKILIITLIIYAFYVIINFLIDNNYNNAFVNTYKLIFVNGDLFKGPLLITLGLFIRKYKINISWLKALLLVIGSFAISILLPNEITKLIFFVSNFLLAMQLNNIKINTIYFRKSSTIFYFMHLLNAFIVGLILGIKEFSGVYTFLIVCLMCTIESIIILFIQNKWNFKFINELFNWSSGKKVSKESSC